MTGCVDWFLPPFAPGTYSGELACTIDAVNPSGMTGSDSFTMPGEMTIDDDGNIRINDEPLAVGQQVTRAIPTADLSFEITALTQETWLLTLRGEPRPTLPGITVEGELIEAYRWNWGSVLAAGQAELEVTDVSGTSTFDIQCAGTLTRE